MYLSTRGRCLRCQPYEETARVAFPKRSGERTVAARFRDAAGNVSTPSTATVRLDQAAPEPGAITATAGQGQVRLTWAPSADVGSGVDHYEVVWQEGRVAPYCTSDHSTMSSTTVDVEGAVINGLPGRVHSFRGYGVDTAGNLGHGLTASATPIVETAPPTTVRFELNNGSGFTGSRDVVIRSTIFDASGVVDFCITEEDGATVDDCRVWMPYAPELDYRLDARDGTKTVRAWFRDPHGNVSETAASDTITFDWTRPENGDIVLEGGSAQVTVSWSDFQDAESGVESYVLVMLADERVVHNRCHRYPEVWRGTDTQTVITGLDTGRFYGFRVRRPRPHHHGHRQRHLPRS